MKSLFVAVAVVVVLAGCKQEDATVTPVASAPNVVSGSVKAGQEATLFPIVLGATWTYKIDSVLSDGKAAKALPTEERVYRVKTVRHRDGADYGRIEVLKDGKEIDQPEFMVSQNGVFQVASGKRHVEFKPVNPVLKFPLVDGQQFSWSGTGLDALGKESDGRFDSTVHLKQVADSAAKSYECVSIETNSRFTSGIQSSNTLWLHPGTGMVRYHETITAGKRKIETTVRLVSYQEK